MSSYEYDIPDHPVTHDPAIDLSRLWADPAVQRVRNQARINKLAANFIPSAAGTLVVSQRADGTLHVIDGQHRAKSSLQAGYPTLPAEVHHNLTLAQEAQLFLLKNREGQRPSVLDEYKIGLAGNLPLMVDTEAVLVKKGLSAGTTSANSIGAVASILGITEKYGADVLERTLTTAELAWGRTQSDGSNCWEGTLLSGLGMFLGRHGDVVTVARTGELVTKIQKGGPPTMWLSKVMYEASGQGTHQAGSGGRQAAMYRLLQQAWDKGRSPKNRLFS